MHRLRVRVLDALCDCGVESISHREQMSQRVLILQVMSLQVMSRAAAILLLAYRAFSNHVESLRSLPRGASREYL